MVEKLDLHYAADEGNMDAVKKIVQAGAPINAFDEDMDWTPLHYAVKKEHIDIIHYLISCGADANARREEKISDTPLGQVAQKCTYEIAKILIDAGADPTIPGWMGTSALDHARKRKTPEGIKVYELLRRKASKKYD